LISSPALCVAQDRPSALRGIETAWWPEIKEECPPALRGRTRSGRRFSRRERAAHVESCVTSVISDDPIHPDLASIVPMSGIGMGLGASVDMSRGVDQRDLSATALVSQHLFWLTEIKYRIAPELRHRVGSAVDRARFEAYARLRELPRLAFFGLGPESPRTTFTFGEREAVLGSAASLPLSGWLRVFGSLEYRRPGLEGGGDPRAVEHYFTNQMVPGLSVQPHFLRYTLGSEFRWPAQPPYGTDVTLGYSIFQDLNGGRSSFGQLHATATRTQAFTTVTPSDTASHGSIVQRIFCTSGKVRSCDYGALTARVRTIMSTDFPRSAVPFYYQPTLGGTDIDGFDTLRGFTDYRFRAPCSWLGQAEYSRHVWGPIKWMLFYDVGKVSPDISHLNFAQLRQDWGPGAAVVLLSHQLLRAYAGFGGGEGVELALKLSQAF
jgi:hypothetical protein